MPVAGETRGSAYHPAASALIAAAVLVGAALRLALSWGDLWLDEIWSLNLVAAVHSPGAVFWGISHDNNHFLNSLWLYLLGPVRAPWAYRAPAVALGTLSILLAARIGLRRGRAAGVAAAWFAALAMPLVVYGSEARGYAGLIFATLLAIEAFEPALEPERIEWKGAGGQHPATRLAGSSRSACAGGEGEPDALAGQGSGWRSPAARRLGLAIGLGTLFHLTMLATLGVLGLVALLRFRQRRRTWRAALDATLDLFGPSLVALVPAMVAVMAGIAARGGFTFGDIVPFGAGTFAGGYGDQIRFMMGLPGDSPRWLAFAAEALVLWAAFGLAPADPTRRCLAVVALVILPGAMMLARLPNLAFPRYFLVPGLVLILVEADLVGRLWAAGAARRGAALLLVASTLGGQVAADRAALAAGRGHYREALALMAAEGPPSYAADNRFMVETVAASTAARAGLAARYVPSEAFCTDPPEWFVSVLDDGPSPPPAITAGPATCRLRFTWRETFASMALSGMRWTLYRRAGQVGSSP